jgi:DNA (cytosine-5)-methyltransferase 1
VSDTPEVRLTTVDDRPAVRIPMPGGKEPLTFGSLFAGIGGLDLGLERAGMRCVWQVEIDDYARRVLAKHWPDVRRHDDVCTFPPAGEWGCDLICGGFPCQDVSEANPRGEGLDGRRSGLWTEFARIVRVVRPRYVLVENVPALLWRGLGRVLGDLALMGFDAEWGVLSACMWRAPHTRERVFVLAYPQCSFWGEGGPRERGVDYGSVRLLGGWRTAQEDAGRLGVRLETDRGEWESEPNVGRVVDGLPRRLDRIRCLGNAVVPQEAEWIGRRIMDVHGREKTR